MVIYMFNRKSQLVSFLNELNSIFFQCLSSSPEFFNENANKFNDDYKVLKNNLECGELFIPIIGGFSAGKSTILNKIIGKDILPVAMTAETAIPAEIRYGYNECIISCDLQGKEEEHPLSLLGSLSNNAGHYQFIKVFVNSETIKDIQPFTFVDMPGFNSNFSHHNESILRYLGRGAFYFYLVNTLDGTLTTSDFRRLNEIFNMGRFFSLFTTKTDLIPENNLSEVTDIIKDELLDEFDMEIDVLNINHFESDKIIKQISKLDPNSLFNSQYINEIKILYYKVYENITNTISSLEKTSEEKKQEIDSLRKVLKELSKERDNQINKINTHEIEVEKNNIIRRLEKELHQSIESLIVSAKSGRDTFSRNISDLVRSILISEFKSLTKHLSEDIIHDLSKSLSVFSNQIDIEKNDWIDNLLQTLQQQVMNLLLDKDSSKTSSNSLADIISTVAIFIPNPVIKIVLAILPNVIGSIFNSLSESRERDKYYDLINKSVIPKIIKDIDPKISSAISDIKNAISNSILNEFTENIEQQKRILELSRDEFDKHIINNISLIESLSGYRDELDNLALSYSIK